MKEVRRQSDMLRENLPNNLNKNERAFWKLMHAVTPHWAKFIRKVERNRYTISISYFLDFLQYKKNCYRRHLDRLWCLILFKGWFCVSCIGYSFLLTRNGVEIALKIAKPQWRSDEKPLFSGNISKQFRIIDEQSQNIPLYCWIKLEVTWTLLCQNTPSSSSQLNAKTSTFLSSSRVKHE